MARPTDPDFVPTITRLELQRRRRNRVNVHLDGEYAFSVALDLAATLHKGQALSSADIDRLRDEDAYRYALDRAMRFLSYRPRSRAEVTRNLADKNVPDPTVARVLDRLSELDLIDDAAFARWWVDNRSRHRPRGIHALRSELATRGVSRAEIAEAVAEVDEVKLATDLAIARASRHAGLAREVFDHRLGGYLRRRGFGYEALRTALNAAWENLADPDPD